MITFLYTIGIHVYTAFIRLAALWNTKANRLIKGRRQIWQKLLEFQSINPNQGPTIWIHCASLGEFEQGRPLIEALRREWPGARLVLTFFSPSGYEIRKNYEIADLICYLPADTPGNAHRFVQELAPDLAIFVKYEFWRNHLHSLHRAGVPIVLISAIFRSSQIFFKFYGGWYRRLLTLFDHIFIQDKASGQLLDTIGIPQYSPAGDTRVDRVLQLKEQAAEFPGVVHFTASAPIWIAGSTWTPDEEILFSFWKNYLPADWKVIIAPHDIAETHLRQIEERCPLPLIRYSRLPHPNGPVPDARVLLIDNIGMLSALYRYGRIAYIGGGFGKAIHNLLEPIAFDLPVIFGPRHQKFQEALALKHEGGGFAIEGIEDLVSVFFYLQNESNYREAAGKAREYLERSRGSTQKILHYLQARFPKRLGRAN